MDTASTTALDLVRTLVRQLPPRDRLQLIAEVSQGLLTENEQLSPSPHSLRGMLADLGAAPSAEDIDAVRHDMWTSFPSEDV